VKRLLSDLEREHPGVRASLFAALGNVMPTHLLDARLYPRDEQTGVDPWIDEDVPADGAPIAVSARRADL
jgi:tRNA 2-thiocytidine biosynthesis protein TtcA